MKIKTQYKQTKICELVEQTVGGTWGPESDETNGVPVLRSTNFTKDQKIVFENIAYRDVTEAKLTNRVLNNGDILIEISGGGPSQPVGRALEFINPDGKTYTYGNFVRRLKLNSDLLTQEYLSLALKALYIFGETEPIQTNTTNLRNLNFNDYVNLEIPIPTIQEQKQIVLKIKECFTLLDQSEEKLKQAEKKLNSVMDSVYHKEIPTPENLSGSTITKLEDLAEKITDGSHNPPMKQKNGKLMLSAINIENDFLNIEANVRYIKEEDFNKELNRSGVKNGDVLLTAVGTIGRTLVVKEFTEFVLQRSVTLIRPKDTEISQYLSYYLRTPYMQRYFLENAKGTAQKGIYLSTIRKLEVVIPERSKMRAIIEKINNVRNATTNSLKHIESLQKNLQIERQSILKKAFEGKLI